MSKPKSRVTVTNRGDGIVIRATGAYALNLIAALVGKSPERTLADLQSDGADIGTPNNSKPSTKNEKENA